MNKESWVVISLGIKLQLVVCKVHSYMNMYMVTIYSLKWNVCEYCPELSLGTIMALKELPQAWDEVLWKSILTVSEGCNKKMFCWIGISVFCKHFQSELHNDLTVRLRNTNINQQFPRLTFLGIDKSWWTYTVFHYLLWYRQGELDQQSKP